MRVLICGSRDWVNGYPIHARLLALQDEYKGTLVLITGGARGADRIARDWARHLRIHCAEVKAIWENGKAAGPIRNRAMLELQPHLVIAFHHGDSRGTADMIAAARKREIPVEIVSAPASGGTTSEPSRGQP